MKLKAHFLGILFILICSFTYGQETISNDSLPERTAEDSIRALKLRRENQKEYTDSIKETYQFPTYDFKSDSAKAKSAPNQEVAQMLVFAKKFLGTPYHWGGTTPSGFDCSGFIYYIMGNFGFSMVRTSFSMAEMGKTVKLSDARPGDLMFFKGSSMSSSRVAHVGMVYEIKDDGIYIIHSSSSRGVVIENFSKSRYLIPRYIKVKQLDYGEL
jgi:cell wall-associated NlpC family hydrolase